MKNIKKLMGICICAVTLVFGILVLVEERDYFKALGSLSFADRVSIAGSILVIAYLVINVLLILFPLVNLFLVAFDKRSGGPYKAIANCALIICAKYLFGLLVIVVVKIIGGDDWTSWKEFLFKPTMAIVPFAIFIGGYIFIMFSSIKSLEGTLRRAVFITIGAGATIFGVIFYKAFEGMSTLGIFGLIAGVVALAGAIVYSFLPQTREYKA